MTTDLGRSESLGAEVSTDAPATPESNESIANPGRDTGSSQQEADDLPHLLAEWDRHAESEPGSQSKAGASQAPDAGSLQQQIADVQRQLAAAGNRNLYDDPELFKLALKLDGLSTFTETALSHLQAQELQRIEAADGAELIEECKSALGDMTEYISDDWIQRWLLSEYHINGHVKEAWDHRRNPEFADQAVGRLNHMIKRMVKDARAIPSPIDHEATEARALVTAAVRGSRSFVPEENSAQYRRRLANMSDAEFKRHQEETYGY